MAVTELDWSPSVNEAMAYAAASAAGVSASTDERSALGGSPMTPRSLRLLTALLLLVAAPGCLGGTQNPSYFPYWLPTGPIIRTHAKPPGRGNFADFDPHAARLEVRPLRSTAPVGTQYLVIATVMVRRAVADRGNAPGRGRRVDGWRRAWVAGGVLYHRLGRPGLGPGVVALLSQPA